MGSVSLTLLSRTWSTWYFTHSQPGVQVKVTSAIWKQSNKTSTINPSSTQYTAADHNPRRLPRVLTALLTLPVQLVSHFKSSTLSHPSILFISLSSSPSLLSLPHFCRHPAKHGALPLPRLIDHQFSSNLDQVSW